MRTLLSALVALFVVMASTAQAVVIVKDNGGGVIEEFVVHYQTIRASNDTVVIDGVCSSACTLVLSIIDKRNVCATENGWLGFHSAFYRDILGEIQYAEEATMEIFQSYPTEMRKMLTERGWWGQERRDLIWVHGSEYYQPCMIIDGAPRVPVPTS